MTTAFVQGLYDFVDYLNDAGERAESDVAEMLRLPGAERAGWLEQHPDALTFPFFTEVLDHAYDALGREPRESRDLADLVLRFLDRMAVPEHSEFTIALLRSRAHRERGNALSLLGELDEAAVAARLAAQAAQESPVGQLEYASALHLQADIELEQGKRAVEKLHDASAVFAAHGDALRQLRALMRVGASEYESGRYEAAEGTFRQALVLATQLGSEQDVVRLHNNLGHCARRLGRHDEALRELTLALRLFEEYGMEAERSLALWGLHQLLAESGQVEQAIAGMCAVRDELLAKGWVLNAAAAALDLLELLALAGQQDRLPGLASEMVTTFIRAGMQKEALRALNFVQLEATAGTLTPAQTQHARTFVQRLAKDAHLVFSPLSS